MDLIGSKWRPFKIVTKRSPSQNIEKLINKSASTSFFSYFFTCKINYNGVSKPIIIDCSEIHPKIISTHLQSQQCLQVPFSSNRKKYLLSVASIVGVPKQFAPGPLSLVIWLSILSRSLVAFMWSLILGYTTFFEKEKFMIL